MKQEVENIRQHLKKYIKNIKALIIGVSGGIDSALCCALAYPVCKELNIPLIGRSLPIYTNKSDEIERSQKIGKEFCDEFIVDCCLEDSYDTLLCTLHPMGGKIAEGNIKARLRMIYLYNLAYENKGIVLSTDNFTEYLLGFWTLHGDVGDVGMIQNLWKTEVYKMSKYLSKKHPVLKEAIDAVPTDGLGISKSDMDQIGCSYKEADNILKEHKQIKHPVMLRHARTEFKRKNPYNFSRKVIFGKE